MNSISLKKKKVFEVSAEFPPPDPVVPKNIFSLDLNLDDISPIEIARQMSLLTGHFFRLLTPKELLSLAWEDRNSSHLSPNIAWLLNQYDTIGNWAMITFTRIDGNKDRAKQLERFGLMAMEFYELGNYHMLFGLMCGIGSTNALRDRKSLELLEKKIKNAIFSYLLLFVPENYLSEMNTRLAENRTVIPAIKIYLKQLSETAKLSDRYFSNESLINFSKNWSFYDILQNFNRFQETVPYNLIGVYQIQQVLEKIKYEEMIELPSLEEVLISNNSSMVL